MLCLLPCTGRPVFVVVLAGHDAEVAKPFGKDDDEDASAEAEYGPERGEVLGRRMGLVIAHEEDIRQGKQHEHRDADQRYDLQPVAQELDELDEVHGRTAWTKLMKNPG